MTSMPEGFMIAPEKSKAAPASNAMERRFRDGFGEDNAWHKTMECAANGSALAGQPVGLTRSLDCPGGWAHPGILSKPRHPRESGVIAAALHRLISGGTSFAGTVTATRTAVNLFARIIRMDEST